MQKLYKDMASRINTAVGLGRVPEEIQSSNEGFSQWKSHVSRRDHDTFLQVISVISFHEKLKKKIKLCYV